MNKVKFPIQNSYEKNKRKVLIWRVQEQKWNAHLMVSMADFKNNHQAREEDALKGQRGGTDLQDNNRAHFQGDFQTALKTTALWMALPGWGKKKEQATHSKKSS